MNKIIALLFHSRDIAHRAHLMVTGEAGSLAMHLATGEFYSDIIDKADSLAEKWMGRNGAMPNIEFISMKAEGAIADILATHLSILEEMRYTELDQKDTALQNIVDEIVDVYLETLFKLKLLK